MTSVSTKCYSSARPKTIVLLLVAFVLLLSAGCYHFLSFGVNSWDPLPPMSKVRHYEEVLLPPTSSSGSDGQVYLFVPINEKAARRGRGKDFCRTMQGAIVNGWQPIIYNWNMTERIMVEKAHGLARVLASPNLTRNFSEEDVIMVIDALDVWPQLSPETVWRRFNASGQDVMVAAEKNCFPQSDESHGCMNAPVSPLPTWIYDIRDYKGDKLPENDRVAPRHANGGGVIGRFDKMRDFYQELIQLVTFDDQATFNELVADGVLKLDYYSRFFWSAYDDTNHIQFRNTRHPPDFSITSSSDDADVSIPWDLYPALGYHTLLGHVPAMIHFNGGSKKHMKGWWGRLWWQAGGRFEGIVKDRMRDAKIRVIDGDGYRTYDLRELCEVLDVWD